MNNYNSFITELNTLTISTRERFVTRDGRILYGEDNQEDPVYYSADTDAERHHDYHRAIFLNLDRYSQYETANSYADTLKALREQALSDMYLLSNEQVSRVIADAVTKLKWLSNLHKIAAEFKHKFLAGTLDDPIYLKSKLLDCFITPNCPTASPDKYFARYLKDAILCKVGELAAFIKLLQASLGNEVQLTPTPQATDSRTNIFNPPMPLNAVERWFIQLAENNSKNGDPFLTQVEVDQFIERAFVGVPYTEKLSINEKRGDKANVIGLFHLFYTHCMTHHPKMGKIDPTATVQKYISLLTDHFNNWTFDEVKDNFRRGGNWTKPTL
ncbi:hypothetical protein [Spirosoma linguale]|uniref:Uncharacterized protein n=1 Tax=Spirosoma linguale (strain ATCC 33905 / DSM 74 / LMG 10896 / Claus 1) TaxID=504472 RepID=D2QNA4_SPILD|nr:hypothetical protein Slin_3282 [Spirosoma linguale DSM 74]